jgi:hypothetical protein
MLCINPQYHPGDTVYISTGDTPTPGVVVAVLVYSEQHYAYQVSFGINNLHTMRECELCRERLTS